MLTIIEKEGLLGPRKKKYEVPLIDGAPVWDYIPEYFKAMDYVLVQLNYSTLNDGQIRTVIPRNRDTLRLTPCPGFVTGLIINVVMAIVMAGISYGMAEWEKHRARRAEKSGKLGPTYEYDLMQNVWRDGNPKQVIYGIHRVGAQIIQQFTIQILDGVDLLNSLFAFGHGPISNINPNGNSDLHVDGNMGTNFRGYYVIKRTGTLTDAVIPNMRGTTTTVAYNSQLLRGEAASVICVGTTPADRFRIKITFVSGMYRVDDNGERDWLSLWIKYRYRETAGPGAWQSTVVDPNEGVEFNGWIYPIHWPFNDFGMTWKLRCEPISLRFEGTFPSKTAYDVEIVKQNADHNGSNYICDPYVKAYFQIADADLAYPGTAKAAVTRLNTKSLSGDIPRLTFLIYGRIMMMMNSATAFTQPYHSQNPADVILDLVYNWKYGGGKRRDTRIEITVNNVVGAFAVGNEVWGPVNNYRFKGIVRKWADPKMTVESLQGVPYTNLTDQTSGATCDLVSVDEARAINLAYLYEFRTFCNEQVPDGSAPTFVDGFSDDGQKNLFVDDTTGFSPNDYITINYQGARAETNRVNTVDPGVKLVLHNNLTYEHTVGQGDKVSVAQDRAHFDFVFDGQDDFWSAIDRICRVSRAGRIMYGSQIIIRALKNETPGQLFCRGNMQEDSFKITGHRKGDKPNRMDVTFRDEDCDYGKRLATFEDPAAFAGSEKIITAEMEMYGITRRAQAMREIMFREKKARYTGMQVQWRSGIYHIASEVWDVVRVGQEDFGYGDASGRVQSSTNTTFTLDNEATVSGGEAVLVIHSDGTEENRILAATPGTFLTLAVTVAWGVNPSEDDLYIIGTPGRFRILSIDPNEDGFCTIIAEEDDPAYYVDDYGVVPTFTESTLPDPHILPPDVENLTLLAGATVNPDASLNHFIDVGFTRPDSITYASAEIWMKTMSGFIHWGGSPNHLPSSVNGEFSYPRGLCCDGTYVYVADMFNHRIVKLNQFDLSFVANIGGPGTGNGLFNYPADVCTDGIHIWVTDMGNHRIQKFTIAGVYVSKIGGLASGNGNDQFYAPYGICTDGTHIWVADTANHRIVKRTVNLVYVSKIGGQGGGDDQFIRPMGIDVSGIYIYVADTSNNRIHKRLKADALTYQDKIGSGGSGDDNFNCPDDIAVNSAGTHIWVADGYNHRIVYRTTALVYVSDVGEFGDGRDEFKRPGGVAHYDSYIFIAEKVTHRVQYRLDDETPDSDYEMVGTTLENSYRIARPMATGTRRKISVVSVSPSSVKKDPEDGVTGLITLVTRGAVPPDVTNFGVGNQNGRAIGVWTPVRAPDLRDYEVRAGTSWSLSALVGHFPRDTAQGDFGNPTAGTSRTYYIKARTTAGVYSATAVSFVYTAPFTRHPIPTGPNWRFP